MWRVYPKSCSVQHKHLAYSTAGSFLFPLFFLAIVSKQFFFNIIELEEVLINHVALNSTSYL